VSATSNSGRQWVTHLTESSGGYASPPPFLFLPDGGVLGGLDVPRRSDTAVEDRFDVGASLVLLLYLAKNLADGRSGLHARKEWMKRTSSRGSRGDVMVQEYLDPDKSSEFIKVENSRKPV
jgi:hypothetical protein